VKKLKNEEKIENIEEKLSRHLISARKFCKCGSQNDIYAFIKGMEAHEFPYSSFKTSKKEVEGLRKLAHRIRALSLFRDAKSFSRRVDKPIQEARENADKIGLSLPEIVDCTEEEIQEMVKIGHENYAKWLLDIIREYGTPPHDRAYERYVRDNIKDFKKEIKYMEKKLSDFGTTEKELQEVLKANS